MKDPDVEMSRMGTSRRKDTRGGDGDQDEMEQETLLNLSKDQTSERFLTFL